MLSFTDICAGRCPTLAAGKDGTLHLVYEANGMKCRKVTQ